ncbi:hypothetical protein ACHHYP_05252 [Achlya hypogyna]|uniref:PX domain-containing protein n=1 Tax=Achlya hypogyna TaxID=1202772 RepID=A0A1V9YYF0_ACHHY|nr:hypothetical protein ACHHYP_05252 [Achlya hypogyna]
MDTIGQARALGRVEGRAEALEEIADLHSQIASLALQVEQLMLDQEKKTKDLMTTVYKELKQEFRRQTTPLTPKEAMEICKPCLRRVAEAQVPQSQGLFRNESFMAKGLSTTVTDSHPLAAPVSVASSIPLSPSMPPPSPPLRSPSAPSPSPVAPEHPVAPTESAEARCHICVAATEKVGSGRSAHMVYVVQVRSGDTGIVLSQVKRRYKDFVWLWERLSSAYVFACIPTLPPKNGLRDNSKFNPRFVEKRKRALQLWMNHLGWHYVLGFSTEMQTFLDGSDLGHVPRTPPLLLPRRRRSSSHEGVDRPLKHIQEKLPVLQRQLVKVSKRLDGLLKCHADASAGIEALGQATAHLGNFERLHGHPTPWDCLGPHAFVPLQQWHEDTYETLDVSLQETFNFQHTQVMPRFEKQVHDLTRDHLAGTAEKLSLEWDELRTIAARTTLESLLHVAVHMRQSHAALQGVWASAHAAALSVETPPPMASPPVPPPPAAHENHAVFDHPTLDRPLKPNTVGFDPDVEDARNLFGAPPANPDAVFSAYQSSDEEEDEEEDAPAFSASWDLYIDRLRRKQKKQAKAEAAAIEETKKKEAEAAAETRKARKRPQSMQWPIKRVGRSATTPHAKPVVQDDMGPLSKSSSTPHLDRMVSETVPTPAPSVDRNVAVNNWVEATASTGQTYYYHRLTRATRWTKPDQAVMDDIEGRLAAQEEATQRRVEERRQWYEDNKAQMEREAAEVDSFRHEVTQRVNDWARNKDVVAQLRSLPDVLPDSLRKSPPVSYQVVGPATVGAVKKAYMKAVRTLHPDKLPKTDFDVKDRFLAQHLFSTLTMAHEAYQRTHTTTS